MKFIVLAILFVHGAFASENDLSHRPHSFSYKDGNAVFVDFLEATYELTYDLNQGKAYAKAEIQFQALESGYPVFDSVSNPTSILLDGKSVNASLTQTPSHETTLRVINQNIGIGNHVLQIELPLTELVSFTNTGVKSALWTSDLDERNYLERYVPANFEFDQVKMNFLIHFIGIKNEQIIYSNGDILRLDNETYRITYPDYFTASSVFFHTVPKGAVDELRFNLKSLDGRTIPAVIYTSKSTWSTSLDRVKDKVTAVFQELEKDYGAFPHPSITVYIAGAGGMEYCGATMTDVSSLGHELFHSYFARGVMPANGNSGWLDEALASWRDDGYQSLGSLSGTTGMSSHAYYTRITDRAAYTFGSRFMSLLDSKTKPKGGLKTFLRYMVATHSLKPIFVEEFTSEMSQFYQMSFATDFKRYTYGVGNRFHISPILESSKEIHHKMNLRELKTLL
jgi:hypothetical protein